MEDVPTLVDHLFRRQSGQMIATLTRSLGSRHLAVVEDAVQDALMTALQHWPYRGVPERPEAWLYSVARNRALDRLRHERIVLEKTVDLTPTSFAFAAPAVTLRDEAPPIEDDQVGLLFLACHPAVPPESRVALALKLVGGFSVTEIARAFLAQEPTIAQRLVRAKRTLREQGVDFGTPAATELAERLDSVLDSLYLMFNEGYAATSGDALVREDVALEAIRLTRLVAGHPATQAPRAWALLALMQLHAARFPARLGRDRTMRLLRDQDRSTWDRPLIAEGLRALDRASAGDRVSAFHLEAGIAACHALASSWDETDWLQILTLYDELVALTKSPVVAVNRAVALSRVEGPLAGLAALDELADHPALAGYVLLPAIVAELWREAGDAERAAESYRAALTLARSSPERDWLAGRLQSII
jgi:RNA polymerase sigma-70 factor (ECF subfamily)